MFLSSDEIALDGLSGADAKFKRKPPFFMEMIGGFRASCAGTDCTFRGRKAQALFVYLAFSKDMIESRERIAGLLWSEKSEDAARVSLRQQISGIRRETEHLPVEVFGCDRTNVWLQPGQVGCDVFELIADLDDGKVPDLIMARRCLLDDFLATLHDLDPAFESWLTIQRQNLHDQVLRRLQDQARRDDSHVVSERIAVAIRNVDPTNETACRVLMQAHAGRGDVAGALRVYKELWNLLDSEYDMEPCLETQALVAEIKSGESEPALIVADCASIAPSLPVVVTNPLAVPAAGAEAPLILIRAFDNDGAGEADMRRVNGFRHDLIAALTRFRSWSVREPVATDAVAGGERKVYELLGTATAEDDRIRMTVLLRRRCDGHYMWSESAAIDIGDWRRAKPPIIERLAAALDAQISAERLAATAPTPDLDLDIHDRWLRGDDLLSRWLPEDARRAEAIFRSIVRDARDFAPAHASLAQILNTRHHVFPGAPRDRNLDHEALQLALTAAKLAPMDSRTRLTLASSYLISDKYEQAIHHYDLALQMNDNDPRTLLSAAQGFAFCGEKTRADQLAAKALRIGAGGEALHWSYHACIRFLAGNDEAAVEAADHAEGATFFIGGLKAAALARMGARAAAAEAAAIFLKRVSGNWFGKRPITAEAVVNWFCRCFPIRLSADRQRLRFGIEAAGLLEGGRDRTMPAGSPGAFGLPLPAHRTGVAAIDAIAAVARWKQH